jgi:type VI secretion system ImpM family protein
LKEINKKNPEYGYFGKLPIFNDFIKYNAGNDEILVLDKWLQEGIILAKQNLKNDWKLVYKNSLPLYFFSPFTGTNKFISGIIFPSCDKSSRDFPFLIFFIFSKNILDKIPFYLVPLLFNKEYNVFERIFNQVDANTSLLKLNEQVNQLSSSVLEETQIEQFQDFIYKSPQEDFWKRIYGDSGINKKYNLIANIFNHEIKNSNLALNFNFSSDEENKLFDICFLLNIIAVSKNNLALPAIFWNREHNFNNSIFFFPSKPSSITYMDMVLPEQKDDRIFSLEKGIEKTSNQNAIYDILGNKELKLKELLQILSAI